MTSTKLEVSKTTNELAWLQYELENVPSRERFLEARKVEVRIKLKELRIQSKEEQK